MLDYNLRRFLHILDVEIVGNHFNEKQTANSMSDSWLDTLKRSAKSLAGEIKKNEKVPNKSLKLGDHHVLDMFKKLREKIIEENISCSKRKDSLRSDLETILVFYFELSNKAFMTEAFINVCIVCDLYYQMRNHLLKHEKELRQVIGELIG